jgi:hypothetical protein
MTTFTTRTTNLGALTLVEIINAAGDVVASAPVVHAVCGGDVAGWVIATAQGLLCSMGVAAF